MPLQRTNSSFVLIKAGFFRDHLNHGLYKTKDGFYPLEECVIKVEGRPMLAIPDTAVTFIPKMEK